jgi:DNA-binding transcriptional LysR family regulator
MDFRDLKLLVDVVERGSLQGAARALSISRTTLRRRLEALEADVGLQLLVRGVAGVALTPAGAVVVEEGRLLLAHRQRMVTRAAAREDKVEGTVRLIMQVGMKHELRFAALSALRGAHPELSIVEREVENPLALLHEPFELMGYFGGPPPPGDWYSRVIARVPFRLLASPTYLRGAPAPRDLAGLAAHPLVLWSGAGHSPDVLPLQDGGTSPVRPWFVSADLEMVMGLVGAGMGLGLGPIFQGSDGLVPILSDVVGTEVTFRFLSPHTTSSDARIRAVHESVTRFLASLPEA